MGKSNFLKAIIVFPTPLSHASFASYPGQDTLLYANERIQQIGCHKGPCTEYESLRVNAHGTDKLWIFHSGFACGKSSDHKVETKWMTFYEISSTRYRKKFCTEIVLRCDFKSSAYQFLLWMVCRFSPLKPMGKSKPATYLQ